MRIKDSGDTKDVGPKQRPKHFPHDANADEPAKLIEQEAVDVEEEISSAESEPIEWIERDDMATPTFEE